MSAYHPDSWKIVVIESKKHGAVYKVLASWYGGFTTGDSWKLSSGIEGVTCDAGMYTLPQSSGSTYYLYENAERMSGVMLNMYAAFEKQASESKGEFSIRLITMSEFIDLLNENPKLLEH